MIEFKIKLANQVISVICRYEYTLKACKEYIVNFGDSIFTVCATDEEITAEIDNVDISVDVGYAEFICLYRKIAELLPNYSCVVMHGAAITYKDSAILFVAPSGTGKSTHIKLWRQTFAEQVDIINGDKPIVCVEDNISVFGTPWAGKENWHKNRQAELKAICILKQAESNCIVKANTMSYLPELLKQVYLPLDKSSMKRTLELFDSIVKCVPVYILECDISQEAVMTAYNAMIEENMREN